MDDTYPSLGRGGSALRTFTCVTFEMGSAAPAKTSIVARDEARARRLVLAELHSNARAVSVDVYEAGNFLWTAQA